MNFSYDDAAIEYLSRKDKRLGEAIARIGHLERTVEPDLFRGLAFHIVGQQISGRALQSVWSRLLAACGGSLSPTRLPELGRDRLRSCGLSGRKADYLLAAAEQVASGAFDIDAVGQMSDADAIAALTQLKGVGTWTAEMLLIFSLQRPDVLSFGDYGIRQGIMRLYGWKTLSPTRFERLRRRLSPYGSVASLYFWAIAGGA